MSFRMDQFSIIRPYLYHLTARDNLSRIHRTKVLYPAADLLREAGNESLITQKRPRPINIDIHGETVILRDQHPLHRGNLELQDNWGFEDLIVFLNHHVFFWPGTSRGPISYGFRHFARYKDDRPVLLRVAFDDLISTNTLLSPMFCKYNSGAPRCTGGKASPRGKQTFVSSDQAEFSPSSVVEVTFAGPVTLPKEVKVSSSPNGPWRSL